MILDTNAVSALFAGDPELGEVLKNDDRHHLPSIVIGEYRYGLKRSRYRAAIEGLLQTLVEHSLVLAVDETTAQVYADVRDELRQRGRPIPENDVWIAAIARQHRQPIVSRDDHFDEVADLHRVVW